MSDLPIIEFRAHKGECPCGGIVKMPRDIVTLKLQPDKCWCLKCGKRYQVEIHGSIDDWEIGQWRQKGEGQ